MGFYPPDALVHEAQRRGIEVLAPDVNDSASVECDLGAGDVRIGLAYVRGVRREEIEALVAARKTGGRVPQPVRAGVARRGGGAGARAAGVVRRL